MKERKLIDRRLAIIGLVTMLAVLACSVPFASEVSEPATQSVAEVVPTLTPQSAAAGVTETPASAGSVTNTPSAATGSAGVTPTATTSCLYNSVYVSDITIPDGTAITAGASFTKTWRIKNNGCQTWPTGTVLAFATTGNQMGGPANVSVPQTAPNGTQDVSVPMVAPATPGDYTGGWKLRTPDGISFGDQVTVVIKSVAPAPAAPTAAPVAPTATTALIILPPPVLIISPAFSVGYAGSWTCGTNQRVSFQIINSGSLALESMRIDVDGPIGTHLNGFNTNTPFKSAAAEASPACTAAGAESLAPGSAGYVSVNVTLPAGGSSGRVTVKMCSANDLGGTCTTMTSDYTY